MRPSNTILASCSGSSPVVRFSACLARALSSETSASGLPASAACSSPASSARRSRLVSDSGTEAESEEVSQASTRSTSELMAPRGIATRVGRVEWLGKKRALDRAVASSEARCAALVMGAPQINLRDYSRPKYISLKGRCQLRVAADELVDVFLHKPLRGRDGGGSGRRGPGDADEDRF